MLEFQWKLKLPLNSVIKKPILDKSTAVLAISQSGKTADTLTAIKEAKE